MADKIYTKKGDEGNTGLLGGHRVEKDNQRLEAYGTVDELNSWIGMIRSFPLDGEVNDVLIRIQHRLFSLASCLALDRENAKYPIPEIPQITEDNVRCLEKEIDRMNAQLPELENFIMPGGLPQVAACHVARTVCRRTERRVIALKRIMNINPIIIKYLNRLSDYLFVLARFLSINTDIVEILWKKEE